MKVAIVDNGQWCSQLLKAVNALLYYMVPRVMDFTTCFVGFFSMGGYLCLTRLVRSLIEVKMVLAQRSGCAQNMDMQNVVKLCWMLVRIHV
mmetsp:Transcript_14201/g.26403  ORF Transcript_14201/g.26403 Transcript_14201/m.26403 type:complete len:91 (+) Transcript_14201:206-478(+)